jgi:hypothetical protein
MSQAWEYLIVPRIWEHADDIAQEMTFLSDEHNLEFVGEIHADEATEPYEHYVYRRPKPTEVVSIKYIDWSKVMSENVREDGQENSRRGHAKAATLEVTTFCALNGPVGPQADSQAVGRRRKGWTQMD